MTPGELFILAAVMSQVSRSRSARVVWSVLVVPLAVLVLYQAVAA